MRFAIIGCGQAGNRRAAAIDSVDGAEIAVCADTILDRAIDLASKYGTEASTDWQASITRSDVDIVIITTDTNLHTTIALAAAGVGKHILCERPLARNPAEGEQIVRAAVDNNVTLKTGFHLRYHPIIIKVHKLIKDGRIGRITFLRGQTGRGGFTIAPPSDWMVDCELSGGGTLMDNGIDLLDLCRFFMGEFKQVIGHTSTLMLPISPCEDNASAIFVTTDGHPATIHSSWTDWQGYLSMDISGTEGYIRFDYDESTITIGPRPGISGAGLGETLDLSAELDRSLAIEIEELMSAIKEHREPSGSGHDGLEALIMAYAVYKSSSDGVRAYL
jgi:predicted dehydrogenase